jgi:hypothetical protein
MPWAALIPVIGDIIGKLFPDPKVAQEAKLKLFEMQQAGQLKELDGAIQIITAEANGSWLQRNWRPMLMMIFASLIVARWFGWTAANITAEEYAQLWNIINVGIGGYVIGRSVEKTAANVATVIRSGKES